MGLTLSQYQKTSRKTAITNSRQIGMSELPRFGLGIADESGEAAGAIKKYLRGDYGVVELKRRLRSELGDILWYVAMVADCLDLDLGDIGEHNIQKLRDRERRNMIRGDGDDR